MHRRSWFLSGLLLLGLWSCFSRKPSRPSLQQYIDTASGGELRYVGTVVDINPMRLLDKKKQILLADSRDSLVQLTATAYTSEPDYSLDIEALRQVLTIRREERQQAETLLAALGNSGLPEHSVSVLEGHCYLLVYAEPSPAERTAVAEKLANALRGFDAFRPVRLWVEWMEPSALRQETGPIVPYGYWQRGDSYHDRNKILSAAMDWQEEWSGKELAAAWTINTGSERMATYEKSAFAQARDWAARDASRPSEFRDDQFRLWADEEQPLLVHFAFPIGTGKPDTQPEEPEGYVTGVFDPDQGTFTKIHRTDTL